MAQSFRILLVEDDDSLRACLGDFLASQGWGVASTAFANEALTLMSRHRFDFGLLDFHLPETTGPELLLRLGAVRPLPSILMSGLANPAEVAAAQQAGFFTFLRKPLDLNRLRQSLEMLIQQHFGGPLAPLDHPSCQDPRRPRPRHQAPPHNLAHNPKAPPEQ
ncbi:MAG: DNA-binding NtrC family response regulator [Planctomycetota bacterium]|jgi:DNA-binding NtrC family response regulator